MRIVIGILCSFMFVLLVSMVAGLKLLHDLSSSHASAHQSSAVQNISDSNFKGNLLTNPSDKQSITYAMEKVLDAARIDQSKAKPEHQETGILSLTAQEALEQAVDQVEYSASEQKLVQLLSGSEDSLKLQRILIGGNHSNEIEDISNLQQQYLIQFKADPDRAANEILRAYDVLPPSEYPNERATLLFIASTLPHQERSVYDLATRGLASTTTQDPDIDSTAMIVTAHAALLQQNADPNASLNMTVDSAGHLADPLVRNMVFSQFIGTHPEMRKQLKAELHRRGIEEEIQED